MKGQEESEMDLLNEVLEMIREHTNLRCGKRKKVKMATTMSSRLEIFKYENITENITGANTLMRAAANKAAKCVNCKSKQELCRRKTII